MEILYRYYAVDPEIMRYVVLVRSKMWRMKSWGFLWALYFTTMAVQMTSGGTVSETYRDDPRISASYKDCYSLGHFGMIVDGREKKYRPVNSLKKSLQRVLRTVWDDKVRLVRVLVFLSFTRDSFESIQTDSWEVERNPGKFFGKTGILQKHERDVVRRRVVSSRTLRKLVGAGYTPRLVWLFGVMLRGIIHCTALPKIFEPPIGWGAGSVVAARFAHREWLPVIMLGWFGSEYYWKTLFGVDGPPDPTDACFDGLPITIHKVIL